MVRGLDKFREQFRSHTSKYTLIGGAACDLIMREVGLDFRATKDLDIVLCLEEFDLSFVQAFWEFIQAGKYQFQQNASGKSQYYRFKKPENAEYPYMLELFSRKPDMLTLNKDNQLTPIPIEEEISSLSAILMDDDYYSFLQSGKKTIEDISLVDPEHLIPLKARAWLDLSKRKKEGDVIDTRSIVKHKNDVFRLFRVINPSFKVDIPKVIRNDMKNFLKSIESEQIDLKHLGIERQSLNSVLDDLNRIYSDDGSIGL